MIQYGTVSEPILELIKLVFRDTKQSSFAAYILLSVNLYTTVSIVTFRIFYTRTSRKAILKQLKSFSRDHKRKEKQNKVASGDLLLMTS